MSRSLNKVELIGNLTRDPELRYTPQGTAVCTFGLATNRQWKVDSGEKKEDVEFHRIVAWQKLAELCAQLLSKGRKTYVEGRLQTRRWTGNDGVERTTTEIVINDMIILDSRYSAQGGGDLDIPEDTVEDGEVGSKEEGEDKKKKTQKEGKKQKKATKSKSGKKGKKVKSDDKKGEESDEDIPF